MKTKAKKVITYDLNENQNGWLMELKKSGDKTDSYLTVAYPGCFKGYHLHKVRESNYVCIKGSVNVITYTKDGREETLLEAGDKMNIPTNVPVGLSNTFTDEAWLVNFPNPSYDPHLVDEQVDYNDEEVLEWVKEQKSKE